MSSYKQTVKSMIHYHPRLHSTEFCAPHYLFFVNGNGYDWVNGQLVRSSKRRPSSRWVAKDGKVPILIPIGDITRYDLYPLWECSPAVIFPDDIKPDWLKALKEAVRVAEMDFVVKTESDIKYLDMIKLRIQRVESGRIIKTSKKSI